MQGIRKNFGTLCVLDGVNMQVEEGSLHVVVGPNGAGKTTLFNLISGFLTPTQGKIFFKGMDISRFSSYQMAHIGVRRSFQVLTLFPELTVLENVRIAIQSVNKKNLIFLRKAMSLREIVNQAYEILDIFGLTDLADRKAGELSHGQQRYLDIGIAIAGGGILILLDEPTSGLVHDEIPRMGESIKKLTPKRTVLLIEHRIEMVLQIADTITVLDYGRVIANGPPKAISGDEKISQAYLGLE